ncbi:hypothetical protein [Streptomyces sp. NBC_00996]|uniref:hypothetical protein n=1 Tax=Streptomyces sp. NBC_00996 TaxID=2903710 RepID=UPI0038632A6A|nr:hypothetical protein OG390_40615 [Streptomyces sp. NBC_00996]
MPVDFLVVQAFDQYVLERHKRLGAGGSDFMLVNLSRPPYGAPMTTECESNSQDLWVWVACVPGLA